MKESFANGTFGLIGLILFFCFFVGVLVWLFRPGMRDRFARYGSIPLKDDTHDHTP